MILTPIPLLLSLSTLSAVSTPAVPPAAGQVRGRHVEARTASVFAGACHYGAEATTSGREAVLAWRFEEGVHLRTNLAGVEVAAAVVGEGNLADPAVARRSILYFSDLSTPAERHAARELLRANFGTVLGRVVEEKVLPLRTEFDGERYRVVAGDLLEIRGELLPGRACCKMPYNVWYRPFTPLAAPVVGCNATFRYSDPTLGSVWERHEENTGFAGDFAIAAESPGLAR